MAATNEQALAGGVTVTATPREAGAAAATKAADVILAALAEHGSARIVFASAPSQEFMLAALGEDLRIDWTRVRSFHMDEYLGLPVGHPQGFGRWLQDRLPAAALPGFERILSTNHPAAEAQRYAELLAEAPLDLTCLGIGVNGHIAFNEPDVTRFDDDELVRRVELTEASRVQQVDEGLFPVIDDVPSHAVTLTVPALTGARAMVATVLGERKAHAVLETLNGPVSPHCPATVLRTHPNTSLYLDAGAASMLEETVEPAHPEDLA